MKKVFYSLTMLAVMPLMQMNSAAAESSNENGNAVKQELKNHFSLYGFIRNYFTFDSRESASGTGNLFYYLPFEREL